MPGIIGMIGTDASEQMDVRLRRMLASMMHEPGYTSGTYVDESLGLWLGWVSHAGSFSDCMPVWNETKDVCLIFSGENFGDSADIAGLKAGGHEFDPENASYIVHLYEKMGLDFIEKLNGWFSGVLVDLRAKRAVVFNDRYGFGRIYYHENRNGLYFSSEAKALLKILPELRRLDPDGLAETFSCGCVLQNRTLFPGIFLLPGGSLWTCEDRRPVKKERYFHPATWEKQPLLGGEEFYQKLKDTFTHLLPRYFQGRGKVGMSLTGGLDGRMIMAWARRAPGDLPCYTFGSLYRDNTDVRLARRVAAFCGQSHETFIVGDQFLKEYPQLVEKAVYISDGNMDVTGSVELYVNRLARRIAPVRLTGNYGSEIVRVGVAFRPGSPNESMLDAEFTRLVRQAAGTYAEEAKGHTMSFIAFKQVPWHHYSRLSVEQSQMTLRSPFLDNQLVSLMYQAPPDLVASKVFALRLIADGDARLSGIPTDRGVLYNPIPVITTCRHHYEEFTFKAEYAYDYGMPQWIAAIDHVLAPLKLERLFLGRHKFYHFRVWYRDRLKQYLKDVLLDARTRSRPYLNGRRLEEMVNSHANGTHNYTSEIHRILTSELIQRQLIEAE
jgi:asparagine synthase (glutamine-hydrolysing)